MSREWTEKEEAKKSRCLELKGQEREGLETVCACACMCAKRGTLNSTLECSRGAEREKTDKRNG